jgi:LPXTG-site transpeptidase (sortase) family protein
MRLAATISRLALISAGILLVAYGVLASRQDSKSPGVSALPAPALEEASPQPADVAPAEPTATSQVVRIEVPGLAIDAPVVSLGVLADGVMESPHTPTDVGWYRFSARPGTTGNAVFAGHVDYANYGPAVFYRLRELKFGDLVRVELADGSSLAYSVVSTQVFDADNAPVQEIVGPTPNETITLITCTGVFDRNVLEYNKRLVVKAERSPLALVP